MLAGWTHAHSKILLISEANRKCINKTEEDRSIDLRLRHAVEMQVPPVGHVGQQVTVVQRVAVQMNTLCLDQQDYI